MASMRLTEATDERSLPLCSRSGGRLRTVVLYNLCMFGGMLDEHHAFVWRNFAPSKVRFFGWLLVKSRIQCQANLLRKGILARADSGCLICAAPLGTVSHIVFGPSPRVSGLPSERPAARTSPSRRRVPARCLHRLLLPRPRPCASCDSSTCGSTEMTFSSMAWRPPSRWSANIAGTMLCSGGHTCRWQTAKTLISGSPTSSLSDRDFSTPPLYASLSLMQAHRHRVGCCLPPKPL
jgi:hypothetical protein